MVDGVTDMNERILTGILRVTGGVSLSAVIFVFVPYAWMNAIHQMLGMGALPSDPIVGYLARTVSAFYALLGGLLLILSFDVKKHKTVLTYVEIAFCLFGLVLLFVDWIEGLPLFWKAGEGRIVFLLGVAMLFFNNRIHMDVEA